MSHTHWAIHRHLAESMDARLALLRHVPKHILLHGADGDTSRRLLANRYPHATFSEYDDRVDWLTEAAQIRQQNSSWLHKLSGKTPHVAQSSLKTGELLPTQSGDMLWANLVLPRTTHTTALLDNWAQALQTHGLLFFTCLGADSFPELRHIFQAASIAYTAAHLPEMHDLGDWLLEHGFYDPIVDTAKIVLSYQDWTIVQQDLTYIGAWQALQPDDVQAAIAAAEQAWQNGLLREITLETVFGHALRKIDLPDNAQVVQFYPKAK